MRQALELRLVRRCCLAAEALHVDVLWLEVRAHARVHGGLVTMPQLFAEGSSTTMHAWLACVRHFRQWRGGAAEAERATARGSAGALALVAVVEHWMYVGEFEDADKRSKKSGFVHFENIEKI